MSSYSVLAQLWLSLGYEYTSVGRELRMDICRWTAVNMKTHHVAVCMRVPIPTTLLNSRGRLFLSFGAIK